MAQSAAAIVAIVAGFIINRVMALSTERNDVERRLNELGARVAFLLETAFEAERTLKAWDTDTFKEEVLREIPRAGAPRFAKVVDDRMQPARLTEEEAVSAFDEVVAQMRQARRFFAERDPKDYVPARDLSDYLKSSGTSLPPDAWRPAYDAAYREARRNILQSTGQLFEMGVDYGEQITVFAADYRGVEERCRESRTETAWLNREKAQLETRLDALRHPSGLWPGVVSLMYFAAVGIVAPIALMPMPLDALSPGYKWASVALFFSGLVGVFFYLIRSTRQLTKANSLASTAIR